MPEHLQFVESVRVRRETRLHWKVALLGVFWILIGVKSLLAHWAIAHWDMPIHSVWIWAPSVFAAAVCTIVFVSGDKDPEL